MKMTQPEMKKAVVLLSGGLDSAVCLAQAVAVFGKDNVAALNMFYGQRHAKELACAEAIAKHYDVRFIRRDLSTAFDFSNSAMLANGEELPRGTYEEQLKQTGTISTYVPFRNGLFLSFAAAIAYSLEADTIVLGAHADDAAGEAYPDCSEEFRNHMNNAVYVGTGGKVRFWAPFINEHKSDIVACGLKLGVPFELTNSCYDDTEFACGTCGTCIDRLKAFKINNAVDPIKYVAGVLESK